MTDHMERNPGEANTRRRRRKKIYYMLFSAVLGGLLGFFLAMTEEGEGSFFSRDFANLSLDPTLALVFSAALIFAFVVLPIWGFTQIDELLREQNLIGMAGGLIAVIAGYPIWVMLYAGGFAPYPHALGVFLLAYIGMIAAFVYAKLRDRLPF